MPAVRAAVGQIAADELRHAQLAFALHGWLPQRARSRSSDCRRPAGTARRLHHHKAWPPARRKSRAGSPPPELMTGQPQLVYGLVTGVSTLQQAPTGAQLARLPVEQIADQTAIEPSLDLLVRSLQELRGRRGPQTPPDSQKRMTHGKTIHS